MFVDMHYYAPKSENIEICFYKDFSKVEIQVL